MAITRKPKAQAKPKADVDALIRKGGSVARQTTPTEEKPVILRLPADVLTRVDSAVGGRKIKTPRHTWLLEAIIEKLERESF